MGSCSPNSASREKIKTNLFFSSPEMVNFNDFYDKRTDIWSVGIICYTLLFHKLPYEIAENENLEDLRDKIMKCKFTEQIELRTYDKKIKDFLMLFLAPQSERTDASRLLKHEIITQYTLWESELFKYQYIIRYCLNMTQNDLFANSIGV